MAVYNLVDVRAAAQKWKINYRGRRVYLDVANLGYELADVADCLCRLTPEDFRKTHYYDDGGADDEYICRYVKRRDRDEFDDEIVDELYVKFCLMKDTLLVDIGSFHPPRFG